MTPGIILCIFAGFAALSLYWLNDRLNVENLIGIWVGLDIQKIQLLPKTTNIEDEAKDIESYGGHVKLIRHIFDLKSSENEIIQSSSTYLSTDDTLAL